MFTLTNNSRFCSKTVFFDRLKTYFSSNIPVIITVSGNEQKIPVDFTSETGNGGGMYFMHGFGHSSIFSATTPSPTNPHRVGFTVWQAGNLKPNSGNPIRVRLPIQVRAEWRNPTRNYYWPETRFLFLEFDQTGGSLDLLSCYGERSPRKICFDLGRTYDEAVGCLP